MSCSRPPAGSSDDVTVLPAPSPGVPGPTLARGEGDAAFLDAPGLSVKDLFDVIGQVLDSMTDGAVLTVYTDTAPVVPVAEDWCAVHHVELVAVIPHEAGGATLALRPGGRA